MHHLHHGVARYCKHMQSNNNQWNAISLVHEHPFTQYALPMHGVVPYLANAIYTVVVPLTIGTRVIVRDSEFGASKKLATHSQLHGLLVRCQLLQMRQMIPDHVHGHCDAFVAWLQVALVGPTLAGLDGIGGVHGCSGTRHKVPSGVVNKCQEVWCAQTIGTW